MGRRWWSGFDHRRTFGAARVLVVYESREVHEGIAALLANVREIAKKDPKAGVPRRNKTNSADSPCCNNVW